ncbi:dipeptide ABC transporter ATP-binding protein [Dongia deserti]|uniref:dipeptide ABC transporter ATP-binding protein n=1 Tax=Dongia deserti TaxID=2268030 RepID=UPI000E6471E2|nr:ABC transporter ATP-binding protein [Dongia deserti]
MTAKSLLTVRGLAITAAGRAITTGTNLEIARGETIAIVGESGSGKSLTAKAIARLLPPGVSATGQVSYDGIDLLALPEREMQQIRGRRLSLMLQDPFTMLNPLMKSGLHIAEMLRDRPEFRDRAALNGEVARRLTEVGITDPDVAERMPFQLSGGMSQRIALAAALARDPELLIADEPSTALDVTTQAEIIKLLKRVQQSRGMGLVLITHNLRLAFSTCDRIYVLYAGSLLEVGSARAVEADPFHPYTLGLLLSEPPADKRVPKLIAIRGKVPRADEVAGRCAFADRCDWTKDACRAAAPALAELAPGRLTACIRRREIAAEMQALRGSALAAASPSAAPDSATRPIVRAASLVKDFAGRAGRVVQALKGVSIEVRPGESVGLVGESGSGKTTLGRILVGLETPTSGRIDIGGFDASDFSAMTSAERAATRRIIQMVFQDPYSTLNPRHSVRRSLTEAIGTIGRFPRSEIDARIAELLREVGLPEYYAERRPSSLSGGERQRVAIARALSVKPKILVCDEPVSALDVSVQAQILNLFKRLKLELGLSYLFITHDLAVVRQIAERIYVLYLGEVVEHGSAEDVISRPQHPYTKRLIDSIPR